MTASVSDTTTVQGRVDKVLARAGLRASPVDPVSLRALHDYLADTQEEEEEEDPPSERRDVTGPSETNDASATTTTTTFREDRLMEELRLQTSLILDLQRRIDRLAGRVAELESDDDGHEKFRPPRRRRRETSHYAADNIPPQTTTTTDAPRADGDDAAPPQPPDADDAAAQPAPPPRDSRVVRLVRVFGQMRRRQVPDFDWGLVIKVVIMTAILFTRLGVDWNHVPLRFHVLGMVLLGGFLLQTGYAQFLYRFTVEENYVYRILILNEDVAPPTPGPPRPGGVNAAAAAAADDENWFDWRETFLGGRIHRRQFGDRHRAPWLWRFLREFGLLIVSFVLSIFPMWNPEPPPPPPPARPRENAEDDDGDDNQNGQEPRLAPRNEDGPGAVRPPVDPAEAEEDNEENE